MVNNAEPTSAARWLGRHCWSGISVSQRLMATSPARSGRDVVKAKASTAKGELSTGLKFATAGLGGIFGWWCVHPLNTCSVQMNLLGASGRPLPAFHTFVSQLVRERGFLSLYDGIGAGTVRQIFYATSRFGLFEVLRDAMSAVASPETREVTPTVRLCAGLSSGALAAVISCPAEVTLIRMSNDSSLPAAERRNYTSISNAAIRILKEEGVLAFWSGVVPFAQRAMLVGACQVGTFDQGKQFYAKQMPERAPLGSTLNVFCAAMTSGLLYATVTMPFESAKNRLASQKPDPATGEMRYKSTFQTIRSVARKEGVLALWNGFPAYYLRCGGHTTTMFMFVEWLRSGLVKMV